MKKKLEIYSEDPLSPTYIEMDIEKGTTILSTEPYMKELYEKYIGVENESDYEELCDGKTVKAKVIRIGENIVDIEINKKHSSFLNKSKEDPRYLEYIQLGEELYVKLNKNTGSGESYSASFSEAIKDNKFQDILDSIGKPIAFKAKVKELIRGGYFLSIDGIQVFMPGSLAGMNKLWDFESLVNKEIIVMPITFSKEKKTIVVSRRSYLKTLIPEKIELIKKELKEKRKGSVTGASKYGIFVEFEECLTGLIPIIELNETWSTSFNARSVKPGDKIEFYIKDIINEYKIILTQNATNPWENIEKKIKPQMIIEGKIISILKYGAFVEIAPGISGLLHNSEFDNEKYIEGDIISIKLTKIDSENKKLTLIKA